MSRAKVGILGASGYVGGELVRLLLQHPSIDLVALSSDQLAGKPLVWAHPNLRSLTRLRFVRHDDLPECDVLFASLPHGRLVKRWIRVQQLAPRIIDLSADFRLDAERHADSYPDVRRPAEHPRFAYALPEWNHGEIREAGHVAIPGCMAHASTLAIVPFIRAGVVRPELVVDAKTGSSGSGATASRSTHHPERAGALRCYRAVGHRHTAEIEQAAERLSGKSVNVHFTATGVGNVRGILVTAHLFTTRPMGEREPLQTLARAYAGRPYVRIVQPRSSSSPFPDPKHVAGTNYCDISVEYDSVKGRLVVNAAIDNLGKGAAGNAVHAMNLMLGLPETAGLETIAIHPV